MLPANLILRASKKHAIMILYLIVFGLFWIIYLRTRTVRTNGVDRGRSSSQSRRGLGAIRAVWSAWRALEGFFPAGGVDKTITGVSALRRYFVSSIIRFF